MKNNIKNTSETLITVGSMAAILTQNGFEIGRNQLFQWLRQEGLCVEKGESYNLPTTLANNLRLMVIKEVVKNDIILPTTMITEKGQSYILNMFLKEKRV